MRGVLVRPASDDVSPLSRSPICAELGIAVVASAYISTHTNDETRRTRSVIRTLLHSGLP
jgi:hypothetical protein